MTPAPGKENAAALASDNCSGVHPAVLRWLERANAGHAMSYAGDAYTAQAEAEFRRLFGSDVSVHMVTTGTAANVLCLQALARSFDVVFCSDVAHLFEDECAAPEKSVGCKLVGVASAHGKMQLPALREAVALRQMMPVHRGRPAVLSLTQQTERGTVYTPDELRALTGFAREHGLRVHMDGSRIANAVAASGLGVAEATRGLGVDLLSFGGTKNGLMMAEAVVCFDPALAADLAFLRKQDMQLVSKHRFLAAQFLAYFEDGLWLRNARHANAMAARLARGLARFADRIHISSPVDGNMVFARLPEAWVAPLQEQLYFHVMDPATREARLVTSFDTREEDIDAFLEVAADLA